MTEVEKYKEGLTQYLVEVCTGNGLLKGTLLSTPDIDTAWVRLAPSFYGDAVREFNHYPEFCLGCAGYLGMAIAFLWDADWARYAEVPYAFFQGESNEPAKYGEEPADNADIADAVKALSDRIRQSSPSCQVILEATWASTHDHYEGFGSMDNFDRLLEAGAAALGRYAGDLVSPIGKAFKEVRNGSSGINLYHTDDYHQGPYGAYLKACVNYLVLCKTRFGTHPADCGLDPAKTAVLRTAAEKVYFDD